MCESNVYLIEDNTHVLVMESVDIIQPDDGNIKLVNIFGEEKTIRAEIDTIFLSEHKVLLKNLSPR